MLQARNLTKSLMVSQQKLAMYPLTTPAKAQDHSLKKSASGILTGPLPPTLVRPITKNPQISEYTAALVSTRDYQQCSDLIFLFCRILRQNSYYYHLFLLMKKPTSEAKAAPESRPNPKILCCLQGSLFSSSNTQGSSCG